MKSQQEANKALVVEAFDTLSNKRDYAAAEKFWSPQYIQHSAQRNNQRVAIRCLELRFLLDAGAFLAPE